MKVWSLQSGQLQMFTFEIFQHSWKNSRNGCNSANRITFFALVGPLLRYQFPEFQLSALWSLRVAKFWKPAYQFGRISEKVEVWKIPPTLVRAEVYWRFPYLLNGPFTFYCQNFSVQLTRVFELHVLEHKRAQYKKTGYISLSFCMRWRWFPHKNAFKGMDIFYQKK